MVEQLSVFLENTPGRLAGMCRVLGDAGINMRTLMVAETGGYGVVRILCDSPCEAKDALEAAGFAVSITPVIAVEVPDRPGGLADVLEALERAGMNVEYAYCFIEPAGDAAVYIFRVDDPDAATAVLGAAGSSTVEPDALYSRDGS